MCRLTWLYDLLFVSIHKAVVAYYKLQRQMRTKKVHEKD